MRAQSLGVLIALAGAASPALAPTAAAQPASAAPSATKPAPPKLPPPKAPASEAPAEGVENEVSEVVVRASPNIYQSLPGAVVGDIAPDVIINPAEIQSYGVSTVTELLAELSPETASNRGRGGESPVVLLNGKRISGFNEVQNIPTEAILRVDILPEEVALKYGFTADQRVVNIVLRPRFQSLTHEVVGGGPTAGGQVSGSYEGDQFQVRGDNRLNIDVKLNGNSELTYASRGLRGGAAGAPYSLLGNVVSGSGRGPIDPALTALIGKTVAVAGVPASAAIRPPGLADFTASAGVANTDDLGKFWDLAGAGQSLSANVVAARALGGGYTGTLNATLSTSDGQSKQGLPTLSLALPAGNPYSPFTANVLVDRYVTALGPLKQDTSGWSGHLGGTLNKQDGRWRFNLTTAYDHGDSLTETGAGVDASLLQALLASGAAGFNPYAPITAAMLTRLPNSQARSLTDSANLQGVAYGPLLKVPAGDMNSSLKIGDSQSAQTSSSFRLGVLQDVQLSRNDFNAQANLDLPLTSRRNKVLSWMGDLSLNSNVAVNRLSDFGFIQSLGYGLNWQPIPAVRLIVSHSSDEAAPSVSQLGSPTVLTPGVPVFDFATGQTVNVTTLSGANPKLTDDHRQVFKVGLTVKPWSSQQFSLTANYVDQRVDKAIGGFPAATAQIEAAFPDHFIRDSAGDLVEEDLRPINQAWTRRQNIRWGFNYSTAVGKAAPRPQGPPGALPRRARADGQGPDQPPAQASPSTSTPPTAAPVKSQTANTSPPTAQAAQGGGPGGVGGRGGAGGFRGGGFGGGGQGDPAQGRFQIAAYHTVFFADQTLLATGGPLLDLLNGAPAGKSGGQPINSILGQMGYSQYGLGFRINATWVQGTTVQGGGLAPSGLLTFSDLTTLQLRLFANFSQIRGVARDYPWLRGARVTFGLYNVLDQHLRVKDAGGATPLGYQAPFLDATGRTFGVTFRKLLF